jgi:uncharacterized short protein YbdD (DUF466 family)
MLPLKFKGNDINSFAEQMKAISPDSIVLTENQFTKFTSKIEKL